MAAVNHLWGNFEKPSPILRKLRDAGFFVMRFLPILGLTPGHSELCKQPPKTSFLLGARASCPHFSRRCGRAARVPRGFRSLPVCGQAERGTWERRRPRLRNAAEDTIFVKEYNAGRELCQALRKYEIWTLYAAFRRRGRLRSHVRRSHATRSLYIQC